MTRDRRFAGDQIASGGPSDRSAQHDNCFGFLRLVFASLVIVSHSAEIIDGNRSREPLTNIFGTMSLGEVGVDAFFIVSGYLIVASFQNSSSVKSYLLKRVRRIYPGFLVSFAICFFLIAPFVGMDLSGIGANERLTTLLRTFLLEGSRIPAFVGLPGPTLNGSLWSIPIEFRCYLLVIVLAALKFYRYRFILLAFTALLLTLTAMHFRPVIPGTANLLGDPFLLIRCLGAFCVGSCYYVFRDVVPYKRWIAIVAAIVLVFSLFFPLVAEGAFLIFGGYLIFFTAFCASTPFLRRINSKNDISYGVYLYAWPIQSLFVYFFALTSPSLLTAITLPITYAVGFTSWKIVERPFVRTSSARLAEPIIQRRDIPAE